MNTARTALADSNVMKVFQKPFCVLALSAILSSDCLFRRFIMEYFLLVYVAPYFSLLWVLQHGWFFYRKHNMILEAV